MIILEQDQSLPLEEPIIPQINVQPVPYEALADGIVNDFNLPTFADTSDKGETLTKIHSENALQPSQPETYVVPFEQFVGFEPYVRTIPRTDQASGVINVNATPAPVTNAEQSPTQYLPQKEIILTGTDTPFVWNLSGLSWNGIAFLLIAVALVIYVSTKGG